jgi:hypothetical protein
MHKGILKVGRIVLLSLMAAVSVSARPAQVILIRHGEKPADDAELHLSERGKKRAEALVDFFLTNPAMTNRGVPNVLIASKVTGNGHGQRPSETLQPLAEKLHLSVQTPFLAWDYAALAHQVLTSPEYDGKIVVICWVHEELTDLAAALGVKLPPPWKGSVFDRAWVINWRGNKTKMKDLPQRLLPGDSKH